jgi:hypothetical protein
MKTIRKLILGILIMMAGLVKGQTWDTVKGTAAIKPSIMITDTIRNVMYISDGKQIVKYDGKTCTQLVSSAFGLAISSMCIYHDSMLYIGTSTHGQWLVDYNLNQGFFNPSGVGNYRISSALDITSMIVFRDTLYIGGTIYTCDAIYGADSCFNLCTYSGDDTIRQLGSITKYWRQMGVKGGLSGTQVNAFSIYNNNLIIGGNFKIAGPFSVPVTANNIIGWNGGNFFTLGSGIQNPNVEAVATYKGNLYAGLAAAISSDTNVLLQWNGSSWNEIIADVKALSGGNPAIFTLYAYNGLLYISGQDLYIPNSDNISRTVITYNGSTFDTLGSGFGLASGYLILTSGRILASGRVTYILGYDSLVYFAGGTFHAGGFTTAYQSNSSQLIIPNNFAVWNPKSIITGIGKINEAGLLTYPNPSTGILNISGLMEGSMRLYDISGRLLLEQKIKGNMQLNLSGYDSGVYLLQVVSGNTVITKRVEKL